MSLSPDERLLNRQLLTQPAAFDYRFGYAADCDLREILFRSLARNRDDYLRLLFPQGLPADRSQPWSLRAAQGAIDGAEYTAAAKGTACGHIFKSGESTYHCKTCAADDTCVLCAKCFESSDHAGHQVFISVSPGNSGCCDCGDQEAWRRHFHCTIHGVDLEQPEQDTEKKSGKQKVLEESKLPLDLVESIRMTISKAADYLCDVFSCSPEQLRLAKTEDTIRQDERLSRLSRQYGEGEQVGEDMEFALLLWNDEKHTVNDVETQVARACNKTKRFGNEKAMEVNDIGRSIIHYSKDVKELLSMAAIIEQLKLTVTIRSARDTFREQMCATIIDWIADISGCAVGDDPYILRNIVCEELLNPWRTGSSASNRDIGQAGIDDHEMEDNEKRRRRYRSFFSPLMQPGGNVVRLEVDIDDDDEDNEDNEDDEINDDDDDFDDMEVEEDGMDLEDSNELEMARAFLRQRERNTTDREMDVDVLEENGDVTEALEATLAGYTPPPPPPTADQRRRGITPGESDEGDNDSPRPANNAPFNNIPPTPKVKPRTKKPPAPSQHWLEKPDAFGTARSKDPCEDLWQRVRLDFLILYDLRLWKILRIHLRHLYITTVVTIPRFKRIIGLRFAGLYTALAQLYLIADREPDHSIINLSVQILTTPTVTEEVVDRGNFLTNLLAMVYTFLTTRQVGFPEDVSPKATLAFDAGAVANRRIFHFLMDLRWLCQSPFIHSRIRHEQRYLLQFLDLVKLHQGVCPNVRARGDHIEYESDTWISASTIVKEINQLCRQVATAFQPNADIDDANRDLQRALRTVAQVSMINSFGLEKKRFPAAEVKTELSCYSIGPFGDSKKTYLVPQYVVQVEPMSFHHPLHYLFSWLLEGATSMSRNELRALLTFEVGDLHDPWNPLSTDKSRTGEGRRGLTHLGPDFLLGTIFDHPLRVCAWLAQMKTGMWVRNGITLRHQAHTYRNVSHRDVGYQRDLFMIQAGLVLCGADHELPGERFLAQMIDRFQLTQWVKGDYRLVPGFEEHQQFDVLEDFYHLLVVALSERGNLNPVVDEAAHTRKSIQRDIAQILCFKPLSFSDIAARVTEKVREADEFNDVLEGMTNFRAPEGLNDVGTFELKPEFVELIDPFYAHYTRNHREEADGIYRKIMARKIGMQAEEVVYEPPLEPINTGLFISLSAFTKTPLFVEVIGSTLDLATGAGTQHIDTIPSDKTSQSNRVETLLPIVLHLIMLATIEAEGNGGEFVELATSARNTTLLLSTTSSQRHSIISGLVKLLESNQYSSCHPTVKRILRKMQNQQPGSTTNVMNALGVTLDRTDGASPADSSVEDKERRRQEARSRQARIMAQMQQQQNAFASNQGLSAFGEDFDDLDDMSISEESGAKEQKKIWNFPTGTCIWCQEETDDQRLYGSFAYLGESNVVRTTPTKDVDFVNEVMDTPASLDRSADELRPFGVAGKNKQVVKKVGAEGHVIESERQGLSKGFPQYEHSISGPVANSCGHIMHYSCFDLYLANSLRRHAQQIARSHPEDIDLKEFICPLCKALGNTFMPIIWKGKECAAEHELHAAKTLTDWLLDARENYQPNMSSFDSSMAMHNHSRVKELYGERSSQYVGNMFSPSLVASMHELSIETSPTTSTPQQRYSLRRGASLSRLFNIGGRNETDQIANDPNDPFPPNDSARRMTELMTAYQRIEDTIKINDLCSSKEVEDGAINPVSPLSRALGLSISAFEIAHRGLGDETLVTSLLAELPEQTLTQFRVLSETIQSYLAVNVLRPSPINPVGRETLRKRDLMATQLLGAPSGLTTSGLGLCGTGFLLEHDAFLFFVDWLSYMGPSATESLGVLQLCYWAEIVKVVAEYAKRMDNLKLQASEAGIASQDLSPYFAYAVNDIGRLAASDDRQPLSLSDGELSLLRHMVDKYALAFLRKCLVAMRVQYGLDFECPFNLDPASPEIERLTALLHLPSISDLFTLYSEDAHFCAITHCWIGDHPTLQFTDTTTFQLAHPTIPELVGLPRNYDTLTEEALKGKCPTTGKDLTDPALCLFCGAIFCSQAVCCMTPRTRDSDRKGGCTQHMQRCGRSIGIFINIRKCMVIFLHGEGNGSWAHAPYLDVHGEVDPALRRHRQLFLNQRRYDRGLRDLWLSLGVASYISRRLEGDVNPGGWETL